MELILTVCVELCEDFQNLQAHLLKIGSKLGHCAQEQGRNIWVSPAGKASRNMVLVKLGLLCAFMLLPQKVG